MINIHIEIQTFASNGEIENTKGTTITLDPQHGSTNYKDIEKYILSNINGADASHKTRINTTFKQVECADDDQFSYETQLRITPLNQALTIDNKFYNSRLGYCVRNRSKWIKLTSGTSFMREISDIIVSDYEVICAASL